MTKARISPKRRLTGKVFIDKNEPIDSDDVKEVKKLLKIKDKSGPIVELVDEETACVSFLQGHFKDIKGCTLRDGETYDVTIGKNDRLYFSLRKRKAITKKDYEELSALLDKMLSP